MNKLYALLGGSGAVAIGLFYLVLMFATDYRINYIWTPLLYKTKMVLILNDEAKAKKTGLPDLYSLYDGPGTAASAIEGANIQNIMYTFLFTTYYRGTSGPVKSLADHAAADSALVASLEAMYIEK